MARWQRIVGWVLAVFATAALVGLNPRFAVVLIPAFVFASRIRTRIVLVAVAAVAGLRAIATNVISWIRARIALVAVAAAVAIVGVIATSVVERPLLDGCCGPPPLQPSIEVAATYTGSYVCADRCAEWSGSHTLVVILDEGVVGLAEPLAEALATAGWEHSRATAIDGSALRLHFDRLFTVHETPVPLWPFRTTSAIDLPRPVPASRIASLPPGPEAAELAGPLSRQAAASGLDIFLALGADSTLTLEYPRFAVIATAPESSPAGATAGRQVRTLPVRDEITADLLSPLARSAPAEKLVTNSHSIWAWLGLAAITVGGLILHEARGAGIAWLKGRLARFRRNRRSTHTSSRAPATNNDHILESPPASPPERG
jgi:hypothetical protein